jgi:predicted anti-sigma-YlaC factor YlaD
MLHIKEEQISAYLDEQLGESDVRVVEAHLRDCSSCRNLRDELSEISSLFQKAERFEPSPFLWNRIEAEFSREVDLPHSWTELFIAGLRRHSRNLQLASAALTVILIAGIVVYRGSEDRLSDQAALAHIDQTYRSLATLDADTYNPFGSALPAGLETNPFTNLQSGSDKSGIPQKSRSIE